MQQLRRGSRPVSASPLPGHAGLLSRRGSRLPSPSLGQTMGYLPAGLSSSVSGGGGFEDFGLGAMQREGSRGAASVGGKDDDEFELFGPAALVDTQTAAASQWVRQSLDQESSNFLGFVQTAIAERNAKEDMPEREEPPREITFEELLPPAENSRTVAAQGLLHVLTLTTRRLLAVDQDEDFGPIRMVPVDSITAPAAPQ